MGSLAEILTAAAPDALDRAIAILLAGGLIAFPTDTVYGVAAHAFLPQAVARLYPAKGRPSDKAIPLLLADPQDLAMVVSLVPPLAQELAQRFWPGPLTLVLPCHDRVPREVTAGGGSVAVRIPDHAVPRDLARRLGAPLAATSANRSGAADAVTAAEVAQQIGDHIDLILDGGACPGGVPSTVLDLTAVPPRILRPGPITEAMLGDFTGRRA
jgi:L-threonylcarbamoyladenylate synthase